MLSHAANQVLAARIGCMMLSSDPSDSPQARSGSAIHPRTRHLSQIGGPLVSGAGCRNNVNEYVHAKDFSASRLQSLYLKNSLARVYAGASLYLCWVYAWKIALNKSEMRNLHFSRILS